MPEDDRVKAKHVAEECSRIAHKNTKHCIWMMKTLSPLKCNKSFLMFQGNILLENVSKLQPFYVTSLITIQLPSMKCKIKICMCDRRVEKTA
jgi:hypothetical protein